MGQATGAVHGYLVTDQARNDSGKFSGLAYVVNEIPVPPQTDNPVPAKPAPANPPLVSTELLVGTEKAAKGSPDGSQGRGRNFRSGRHVFLDPQQLLEWCQRKLGPTSAATMDSSNIPPGLSFTKRLCKGFEADALTSDFLASAARGQLRGYPWGNVTPA
jgi:hypothetical protein